MRMLFLAAGAAALAISAPVAGEPRGSRGDKRAQAAKAERGGGERARGAKAERRVERARGARAERKAERRVERSRNARAEQRAERKSDRARDRRAERARSAREDRADRQRAEKRDRRADRVREARAEQLRDRRQDRVREARAEQLRDRRRDRVRAERIRDRREELRDRRVRLARTGDRDDFRNFDRDRFERRFERRGLPAAFVNGCPPGLAKQNDFCMPPGQLKKLEGRRLPSAFRAQALPTGLRSYYRDDDDHYWRYGNGFAYKVDREDQLIRSVLPLIGAGLGIGMPFPYSSPNYVVPTSYRPFYQNTADDYYRYANGYVYEIDRDSGLIEDMIPLLDNGYGVGQMLPASYSYYNVPYQYRSYYQDDDDYLYRYAPGAIYQVDRETRLITAIVSLLTGNSNSLAVGQPLPMGYDMYNVPYAYRDRYYDTPDSWYRYSNGNIYQVDPTTRLITAIVSAIV